MPGLGAALLLAAGSSLPPPVAPFGMEPLPSQWVQVPMIFPVVGKSSWKDSYNQPRGSYRHTGQDIRASKMTPIVAPWDGSIGFKRESFWIYGDNGWRCLGTHLNDDTPGTSDNQGGWDTMFAPNLIQGGRVAAGQLIGYVGDSGNATGPHLHFEIHGPDGIRNPRASLKMAQRLTRPVAVVENREDIPAPGQERWDACLRALEPETSMVKVILVSRTLPGKAPLAEMRPTFAWIKLAEGALGDQAAWDDLRRLPGSTPVRFFIRREPGRVVAVRVGLPGPASEPSASGQS